MPLERVIAYGWLILIPLALVFSIWREQKLLKLAREKWRLIHRIDRVLTVLAETWGQSPVDVRNQLLDALTIKDEVK